MFGKNVDPPRSKIYVDGLVGKAQVYFSKVTFKNEQNLKVGVSAW